MTGKTGALIFDLVVFLPSVLYLFLLIVTSLGINRSFRVRFNPTFRERSVLSVGGLHSCIAGTQNVGKRTK